MENQIPNQLPERVMVSSLSEVERAAFYKKTYTHVAGGVLAFVLFEYLLLQSDTVVEFMMSMTQGYKWLLLLGGFMLATNYAEGMALKTTDRNMQYLAYGIYIFFEAVIFVPMIYIAAYYMDSGSEILNQAAIVTLALFTGLSAAVLLTKTDFSYIFDCQTYFCVCMYLELQSFAKKKCIF